jgi:hypothetical protein
MGSAGVYGAFFCGYFNSEEWKKATWSIKTDEMDMRYAHERRTDAGGIPGK